ncbi:hypothetical protein [Oligoflexus tunisiensis]|uniref:hypothetical protein n=1 Tax=Oligoflexus tunisiensis TaxID=708132 RepID=UPI00114CAAB3|nr:hypothetical protein [Oligoflexus tunisiensis]
MTVSLLRNLALGISTVLLAAACTSSQSDMTTDRTGEVAAGDQDTARENVKEGWQDVKEGTKETADDVGQKTREVSREVSAEIKEAGTEMKASACPVIGNRNTKRYYTQTDKDYPEMLKGEKILSADNRECFMTERAALNDGYIKAR